MTQQELAGIVTYSLGSWSACSGDEVEGDERDVLRHLIDGHILADSGVEASGSVGVAWGASCGVSGRS